MPTSALPDEQQPSSADPSRRMAERVRDLLYKLDTDGAVADPVDEVESLVHDLTCVVLDWMGSGHRSDLDLLLVELDSSLTEVGAHRSPLKGMSQRDRLIVKVLEVGRFVRTFGRTSTAVHHMSMHRGLRSPNRRKLMLWALAERSPFTAPYARARSETYEGPRMNEALDELVEAGWLAKTPRTEGNPHPLYAPTWDARIASDSWTEITGDVPVPPEKEPQPEEKIRSRRKPHGFVVDPKVLDDLPPGGDSANGEPVLNVTA